MLLIIPNGPWPPASGQLVALALDPIDFDEPDRMTESVSWIPSC
jgi:hypothetical protein